MKKGKVVRMLGFVGALGVTTALVTTAVQGTGAYFTDSHDGTLTATAGKIQVATEGTTINLKNVMPGSDQSETINYTPRSGSQNLDIWMVFDTSSSAYNALTGESDGVGGLGHFAVSSDQGYSFNSYNVSLVPTAPGGVYNLPYSASSNGRTCAVNVYGNGGMATPPTWNGSNYVNGPKCGIPNAIKLASNIAAGVQHSATVTFGLTTAAGTKYPDTQGQGIKWIDKLPFTIVATQVNVRPDAH